MQQQHKDEFQQQHKDEFQLCPLFLDQELEKDYKELLIALFSFPVELILIIIHYVFCPLFPVLIRKGIARLERNCRNLDFYFLPDPLQFSLSPLPLYSNCLVAALRNNILWILGTTRNAQHCFATSFCLKKVL